MFDYFTWKASFTNLIDIVYGSFDISFSPFRRQTEKPFIFSVKNSITIRNHSSQIINISSEVRRMTDESNYLYLISHAVCCIMYKSWKDRVKWPKNPKLVVNYPKIPLKWQLLHWLFTLRSSFYTRKIRNNNNNHNFN